MKVNEIKQNGKESGNQTHVTLIFEEKITTENYRKLEDQK